MNANEETLGTVIAALQEEEKPVNPPETVAAPVAPVVQPVPASNGEWKYFKKCIASMLFFVDKKPVQFEPLDRNFGVLKIESGNPLTGALTSAATARRGGIVAIDAETYESLKKNLPFKPLAPKSSKHVLTAVRTQLSPKSKGQNGNAAVAKPFSGRSRVGPVGGSGAGEGTGMPAPVPVSPPPPGPDGFKPATGKKNPIMPVTKKSNRVRDPGEPDLS